MADEKGLADFLSEHEIDLLNRVRGLTEEGYAINDGWSLMIAFRGGQWHVDHHHVGEGENEADHSVGRGATFSAAWADQYLPGYERAQDERATPRPALRLVDSTGGANG